MTHRAGTSDSSTAPARRGGASIARPRAFSHPLWWCALALLVANDHVLKGAGLLPAALTGKLSDVAGMIVAPPLLSLAFLRARAPQRSARVAAVLVVAGAMAAIKLSPLAARALELVLARIALPWRVCADATDLWALLALPLGYLLSAPANAPRVVRRGRELVHQVGIAIASLACIATGLSNKDDKKTRTDAPAIQNHSSRTVTLVIASTEGAGGCRIYRDDRIGLLTSDAFNSGREIALEPDGEVALVDDTSTAACGAASIGLANGQQQLVFWRDLQKIEGFVPDDDPERVARRVVLDGKPDHYTFAIGDDLQAFELGQDAPETTCEASDVGDTLEFSELPVQGFLQPNERRTGDDGCFEIDWFMAEGDTTPKTQRLCVPEWAFPFTADDTLAVTQTTRPTAPDRCASRAMTVRTSRLRSRSGTTRARSQAAASNRSRRSTASENSPAAARTSGRSRSSCAAAARSCTRATTTRSTSTIRMTASRRACAC